MNKQTILKSIKKLEGILVGLQILKGGAGSGNFNHPGRPGKVGGSGAGGGKPKPGSGGGSAGVGGNPMTKSELEEVVKSARKKSGQRDNSIESFCELFAMAAVDELRNRGESAWIEGMESTDSPSFHVFAATKREGSAKSYIDASGVYSSKEDLMKSFVKENEDYGFEEDEWVPFVNHSLALNIEDTSYYKPN